MAYKKSVLSFILAMLLLAVGLPFLAGGAAADGDEKIVIMLDPGHGGKESGTGEAEKPEQYYNLQVALACKAALDADGRFETYLTRSTEKETLELIDRGMAADKVSADLLLSIHFDGRNDTKPHGCAAFVSVLPRYQMAELADRILSSITSATPLVRSYERPHGATKYEAVNAIADYPVEGHENNIYYWDAEKNWSFPNQPEVGPRRDYYGVIKWCCNFGIPSVIVEHCFLSNADDRAYIEKNTAEACRLLGEADAAAIISYYTDHTHSFGEIERDFPSTCCFQGKQSRRCAVCGCRADTILLPAAPDNHYYVRQNGATKATCEKDGCTEYLCEITRSMNVAKAGIIKDHVKKEITKATGHSYALIDEKQPSHGVDGYQKYKCSKCGDSYQKTLKGEAHQYVETERIEPTCVDDGCIRSVCSICGDTQTKKTASATGHSYEVLEELPPTCTEKGRTVKECAVCGDTVTDEADALGHDMEVTETVEPTCTEDGQTVSRCRNCEESVTGILPAVGHRYEADENGREICTVCGESKDPPLTSETSGLSGDIPSDAESVDTPEAGSDDTSADSGSGSGGGHGKSDPDRDKLVLALAFLLMVAGAVVAVAIVTIRKVKDFGKKVAAEEAANEESADNS